MKLLPVSLSLKKVGSEIPAEKEKLPLLFNLTESSKIGPPTSSLSKYRVLPSAASILPLIRTRLILRRNKKP
jgi:hypothetical protein